MHCAGYFHIATGLLEKVTQVQRSFLQNLNVSDNQVFLDYNFAPAKLRRNIAILGLFQKRLLGQCHPTFDRLLPWASDDNLRDFGHNKQLYIHWRQATQHCSLFGKFIFQMINIYNNLPQHVVDSTRFNSFQHLLTEIARSRCRNGDVSWASSFCARGSPDLNGPRLPT